GPASRVGHRAAARSGSGRSGLGEQDASGGMCRAGAECRRGMCALAAHAKCQVHLIPGRCPERHLPAPGAEDHAAVLANLEPYGPQTAGLSAGPVAEPEHAALQPALGRTDRDGVAVDLAVAIRDLQGDPVARRVEARRSAGEVAAETEAVPPGLWRHPHGHPAQRERVGRRAAVGVLVVDAAVPVVVQAVAADLDGAGGIVGTVGVGAIGRTVSVVVDAVRAELDAAALNPLRLTYPCSAYVGGAGVVVVAVRSARTGPTAIDRRPLAAVVGAARVGGAGIGSAAGGRGGGGGGARAPAV